MKSNVSFQKLKDFTTERSFKISPYWDYVERFGGEDPKEPFRANPDEVAHKPEDFSEEILQLRDLLNSGFVRKKLTPKQRAIFTKVFDKNMSFEETAHSLGVSRQYVNRVWNRIIVKFRKHMVTKDCY